MYSPINFLYKGRKIQKDTSPKSPHQQSEKQVNPLHRERIMAELRMKFGSAAAFERSKGLRERSVRDVLSAGKKVEKTAKAIATALDIPIHLVSQTYFDDQYPNGSDSSP